MIIEAPFNNTAEREYIFKIFFSEFLGQEYEIQWKETNETVISLENGNKLIFADAFWNKFPDDLDYLHSLIPQFAKFGKNEFTTEEDIPIIYGTNDMRIEEDKVICGIDIFASGFFMLTRWEEAVSQKSDPHGRFIASSSLAWKSGFLDRPVVNEYVEMLWSMLVTLGHKIDRKKRKPKLILTHDVYRLRKYSGIFSGVREILGDFFIRKNLSLVFSNILKKIKCSIGLTPDPYDSFEYLMDYSDKLGLRSNFFFMSGGSSKFDNLYDINSAKALLLIEKIRKRSHNIGFLPSYNTFDSCQAFSEEKAKLERVIDSPVRECRQSFLRFRVPDTWLILDTNKMISDFSLGYPTKEGFRCGTCFDFPVFHVFDRKSLNLREFPLIVMDKALTSFQSDLGIGEMKARIFSLIGKTKKYNGNFVLLWHNSSLTNEKKKELYASILNHWNSP